MFESLSERLQGALGELRGHGKLSSQDIDKAMREIRLALLEADVNFRVVKQLIESIKVKAMGEEVLAAAIGFDEAEALRVVEPLHGTGAHCISFHLYPRRTHGAGVSKKGKQGGN